jgi:hypothetical protein
MIKPEDEVEMVVDRNYTKDEIVAKLLGWMQGADRLKFAHPNKANTGIIADHVAHMPALRFPVKDQLIALREEAQESLWAVSDMIEAAELANDSEAYNAAIHLIAEKDAAIAACEALINKAAQFIQNVDDEIGKGDDSAFEIFLPVHENAKEPLYTVNSVEQWSLKKYGLSVVDFENSATLAEEFREKNAAVDENYLAQQSVFPTTNQTWTPIDLVQTQVTTSKYGPFVSDYPISSAASDLNRYLHDPKDPAPVEEWYPAARYFARKYIAEHPKQEIAKLSLAPEVAKLMAEAKIFHTGNTPYGARTIRKALNNVKL